MENKEKFTPGPWYAAGTMVVDKKPTHSRPGAYSWDGEFREICDTDTFDVENDIESEANAALIAAAPTMYHELELVRELLNARRKDAGLKSLAQEIDDVLRIARGEK